MQYLQTASRIINQKNKIMKDIEVKMPNRPGNLALLGELLGKNSISLEGGGVFTDGDIATAHFLVEEAERAAGLLSVEPFLDVKINKVLIQRLRQDVPGQLGLFCHKLAEAGINILVQYSDHSGQLIVVVDDFETGKQVSDRWMKELAISHAAEGT